MKALSCLNFNFYSKSSIIRSTQRRCSVKKRYSYKFHKIHWKAPVPGLQASNFIKKETLAQVFSCEFSKVSENTFFTEHLLATASDPVNVIYKFQSPYTLLWVYKVQLMRNHMFSFKQFSIN